MTQKNKIIVIVLLIAGSALGVYLWRTSPTFKKAVTFFEKPKVVEEILVIPDTKLVSGAVGRTPSTEN